MSNGIDVQQLYITQHAIDQFSQLYLQQQHRAHRDGYYVDLIRNYLRNARPHEIPEVARVEKILKYGPHDDAVFYVNTDERLLFIIANSSVVSCHHPYEMQRNRRKALYPKTRRRRR